MRRLLPLLLVPLLLSAAGCDTSFPDEEMDVAGAVKTRPLAVVCDPPEAAPGETVFVTLYWYDPDPAACAVTWRVALDYDLGLYETDEVERDYVAPDAAAPPVWDDFGFCTQSLVFTIPADALLRASSQPATITDELVLALARELGLAAADEPLAKEELDRRLAAIAGGDVPWEYLVDPAVRALWDRLGDLFACEIRFRASLDGAVQVDVTKNLTVRYSSRLTSLNVNANPALVSTSVQAVPHPDVEYEDLDDYAGETQRFVLTANGWSGDVTEVPLHADWTYYLVAEIDLQQYTSPFSEDWHVEDAYIAWFHYDLDDPGGGRPLFVRDDGEEAEMSDLNESVRLSPPGRPGRLGYRIATCLRDERLEWRGYAFAPGADMVFSEFVFVEP